MGKITKPPPPDHLMMDLFAPGMSIMHRAGLGGLTCTLKAMERQYEAGLLTADKLPAPLDSNDPPWEVTNRTVTLKFGKPENAGEYLKKLFAFAFTIRKDGLIYLPGQYESEPSAAVLADLQAGIVLTFLQHGKVRQLAKETTTASYDPDGSGGAPVVVEYRKCTGFKHQEGWKSFIKKDNCLSSDSIKVDGPISPGTVVRHVAFTGDTAAEDPPERMLPLYFSLIGCLPLPVNRGVAALVVPEVENLEEFQYDRPAMTPTTAAQCQITNAADAALQAQIRLRGRHHISGSAIPGCYAMTFRPTAWASQQKSRIATIHVALDDDKLLDRFDRALAFLPTRVISRTIQEKSGRGKEKIISERKESFRSASVIRPLIAENLALGRPWYAGFVTLMTKMNPATDKPYRDQIKFEQKGLHDMMSDQKMWDHEGEILVVKAIHEAIRQSFGRIREETDGKAALSQATKNRWDRFRERLRLELTGAKTEAQVRFALTDLFSRGGSNSILRTNWTDVLFVIRKDWELTRDLSLLALASYVGKGEPEGVTTASETK